MMGGVIIWTHSSRGRNFSRSRVILPTKYVGGTLERRHACLEWPATRNLGTASSWWGVVCRIL